MNFVAKATDVLVSYVALWVRAWLQWTSDKMHENRAGLYIGLVAIVVCYLALRIEERNSIKQSVVIKNNLVVDRRADGKPVVMNHISI